MADEKKIKVPDIGGAVGVDVIEILVNVGDVIDIDTPLITLESDKASMEIPSPIAGVVRSLEIKIGDKVSEGDVILTITSTEIESKSVAETLSDPSESSNPPTPVKDDKVDNQPFTTETNDKPVDIPQVDGKSVEDIEIIDSDNTTIVSAGPAVRRLAREFGIQLAEVKGTGRKSRVSKDDITQYIKNKINEKSSSTGLSFAAVPSVDFSKFGGIEVKPLNKIKRLTGINVHRSWVTIPHVTQFDEADITELEAFRKAETAEGRKLTVLAFVCKIVGKALEVYPQFNTSLDISGESLIYKQYYNIGIAVETPNGLVVPVIKEVNRLSVSEIAREMTRLSTKARDKGLLPSDMSGGCFTISNLGGIGGTAFTPIVNSPEVAILGLSRTSVKPIYKEGEFTPRLILPLSLSYDHRVIDGAEAARFTRYISDALCDVRRILL